MAILEIEIPECPDTITLWEGYSLLGHIALYKGQWEVVQAGEEGKIICLPSQPTKEAALASLRKALAP